MTEPRFEVLKADLPTANGCIYPKALLEELAAQINANGGRILGHLGSPPDGRTSLSEASHQVLPTARVEGDALIASIRVLDTPAGRTLADWLASDTRTLRAVSRGLGTVDDRGNVSDFKLTGIDMTQGESPT